MALFSKDKREELERGKLSADKREGQGITRRTPSVADYVAGESKNFVANLTPYLPQELIGGSIPHVPGVEEEAVWNAASQACGTEKVHFVYSVQDKRIWYLACPSSALSSAPDSWCPLAAALPGNSEYWDQETVYLYEQEGLASCLRWDPDTGRMQVFLGAARTLLPRIQSMDANFVTINPDAATPVSWKNRKLRSEQLSRAAARALLLVGIFLNLIIFGILAFEFIYTNMLKRDLRIATDKTERASNQLMVDAYNALQSDTIKHMVRIQQLLDELRTINGTLVKYEVSGSKVIWEALVPQSYSGGIGSIKGEALPGVGEDGRIRLRGTR